MSEDFYLTTVPGKTGMIDSFSVKKKKKKTYEGKNSQENEVPNTY